MKNSFFKTSILIEFLLIIIVSAYFLTNLPPSNNRVVTILNVHPYEFYLVLAASSIVLLISSLIALFFDLIIQLKVNKVTEDVNSKPIIKNQFWKFTFYGNVIISILILTFTVYTYLTNEFEMILYNHYEFNGYLLPVLIGQFIVSLCVGALLLSSSTLWKQNKALGIITLCFGFLLTILPLGYGMYLKAKCYYDQEERLFPGFVEEGEPTAVVAAEDYEEEHYDMGEEYEEGNEEDYFSFSNLWDNPAEDEEKVRSAIKLIAYGILDENGKNSLGTLRWYYNSINTSKDDNSELSLTYFKKIKENIKKQPDIVKQAFDNYKYLLYEIVPTKLFIRNDGDIIVELLLLSYYDIKSDDNPDLTLSEISKIMTSRPKNKYGYYDDATEYYQELKLLVSEKMISKYKTLNYGSGYSVSEGDIVWAYSFWARRNKEGNTQAVLEILNEVKKHYDE